MLRSIKAQVGRVSWFLQNYRQINRETKLLPSVFHGPLKYAADSVVTSNNADFMQEPRFRAAYNAAVATGPGEHFNMPWRVYIVCTLADIVKDLPGDFVECGVNSGACSRAVIDYVDFQRMDKTFYLLDTYDGLVPDQIRESERKEGIGDYLGAYKNMYERAKETFGPFRTKIIKGMVPDTLKECDAERICYLSIDMNVVEPEIAAANFFWPKLVKGGVIILDDYGFPRHIEQKLAFDKFAREKNVSILYLPTGQGIIFKP